MIKMLSFNQIVNIITTESENACAYPHTAYAYFERYYAGKVNMSDVRTAVAVLNFAAIRENQDALLQLSK